MWLRAKCKDTNLRAGEPRRVVKGAKPRTERGERGGGFWPGTNNLL